MTDNPPPALTEAGAPPGLTSPQRLAVVFEAMSEGVVVQDQSGQVVEANAAALHILGLSRDELLGRSSMDPAWRAVHPDGSPFDGAQHPAMVTLRNGRSVRGQVMGVDAPRRGERRWLSINTVPLPGAPGEPPAGVVASFSDITELAHGQAQLQRLMAEQQTILDTGLVGLVKLRDGRGIWANAGMAEILGYGPDELLGQPTHLLSPDDASHAPLVAAARAGLAGEGRFRTQLQLRHKNGHRVWVDLSGALLPSEPGVSLWLVVDISALKAAEADRLRAAELAADNRRLQESSRQKSQFLTHVSHEMRTPLTAVIGLAGLLERGIVAPGSPKFKGYLAQIGHSGRALLGLIDAVLALAEAEAGKLALRPAPLQLSALVRRVLTRHQPAAEAQQVLLWPELDPQVEQLVLDAQRLEQVLSILLDNAIRFSPAGGQVVLRAAPAAGKPGQAGGPHNPWVRIEVQDNGVGMAAADLPRLFKPFSQLSNGLNRSHSGAGLGLALAQQIALAQGGEMGVQSALGLGSVFHLLLPRVAGAAGGGGHGRL